jgi:cytochrome b6-f complex iron-sulfur subunit
MTVEGKGRGNLSRRQFLGWAWAASAAWLVGQTGIGLYRFFKPRVEPGEFGGEVVAGAVDEFEPGTVSHVQSGHFFISRLADGGVLYVASLHPFGLHGPLA